MHVFVISAKQLFIHEVSEFEFSTFSLSRARFFYAYNL